MRSRVMKTIEDLQNNHSQNIPGIAFNFFAPTFKKLVFFSQNFTFATILWREKMKSF